MSFTLEFFWVLQDIYSCTGTSSCLPGVVTTESAWSCTEIGFPISQNSFSLAVDDEHVA
jgi:hypothetical protein